MTASVLSMLIRLLAAAVFFLSAVVKVVDPWPTKQVIAVLTGADAALASVALLLLIAVEWCLAVWLASGFRARSALVGAAITIAIWSVGVILLIRIGWTGGCGCGIPWVTGETWPLVAALIRNIFLVGFLAVAAMLQPTVHSVVAAERNGEITHDAFET